MLKGKDSISNFVQLNLVIKIFLLISILIPFSTIVDYAKEEFDSYINASQTLKKYQNTAIITGVGITTNDFEKENKVIKEMHETLSELGFYHGYHEIAHEGNTLKNDQNKDVPYYFMRVNENYFNTLPTLYDENNNIIDINNLKKEDLLFVHDSLRDSDFRLQTQWTCQECDVVFYSNTLSHKLVTIFDKMSGEHDQTFVNPIIYLPRNAFKISFNSFQGYYYREFDETFTEAVFESFLEENQETVSGNKAALMLEAGQESLKYKVLQNVFYIAVILITIISMTFQNTYSYFMNQRKNLTLKYLHGVSFIKRYFIIYILNTLIYYMVYRYAERKMTNYVVYVDGTITKTLIMLALFDIVIITLMFKNLERKHLTNSLKN